MELNIFGKELFIKIEMIITLVVILCILTGVSSYRAGIAQNDGIIIQSGDVSESNANLISNNSSNSNNSNSAEANLQKFMPTSSPIEEHIRIYVVGCVKKPGMVTVKKGDVIYDAVQAAGGASTAADLNNINMAYILNENCMLKIYAKPVPVKAKISTISKVQTPALIKPTNKKEAYDIIKDSGGTKVEEKISNSEESSSGSKININTASVEDLDKLSGVGPSTAADIISYRQRNGGFKKIEDIMKVPGIKEKTFSKIRDQISV